MMKIIFICLLCCVSGCKSTPIQNLDPEAHPEVVVYPSLDMREDKNSIILKNFEKHGIFFINRVSMAEYFLRWGNYYIPSYLREDCVVRISYDQLLNPDSGFLKSLPPSDKRYILVVVLKEFSSTLAIGHEIRTNIEGYLIDKKEGEIIWKNSASSFGREGVLGPLVSWYEPGSRNTEVMQVTMGKLLTDLPVLEPDPFYNQLEK